MQTKKQEAMTTYLPMPSGRPEHGAQSRRLPETEGEVTWRVGSWEV